MKRRRFLGSPLLLVAGQAFARPPLDDTDDYAAVRPGIALNFPHDFGSHPHFRSEWWYITGWVRDAARNDYGVQVTFFRNRPLVAERNSSRFAPQQLLFAHAAIADPRLGRLRHSQIAARAGFGLASAAEFNTDVTIGPWSLVFANDTYVAKVEAEEFVIDLTFTPKQDLLLQGDHGFSRKGRDVANASYYYSSPHLGVTGRLTIRDKPGGDVVDVTGAAWLDHEWSSQTMPTDAVGWDWTGINLHDGGALMAFRMRDRAGQPVWGGGTLRAANAAMTPFAPADVSFLPSRQWRSPRTGIEYPVAMRLRVAGEEYTLEPLLDDQELDSRASTGTLYWEGAVRAMKAGKEVGVGYLELTGYGKALKL